MKTIILVILTLLILSQSHKNPVDQQKELLYKKENYSTLKKYIEENYEGTKREAELIKLEYPLIYSEDNLERFKERQESNGTPMTEEELNLHIIKINNSKKAKENNHFKELIE